MGVRSSIDLLKEEGFSILKTISFFLFGKFMMNIKQHQAASAET